MVLPGTHVRIIQVLLCLALFCGQGGIANSLSLFDPGELLDDERARDSDEGNHGGDFAQKGQDASVSRSISSGAMMARAANGEQASHQERMP
jgi:hypothetical protein